MGAGVASIGGFPKNEPAPAPGPPFAPGSAVNGLSLNGTGQIVLGNDLAGAPDAILLNDREIPFAGFTLQLSNTAGTPGRIILDPPQVRSQNAANTASSVVDPGQITIGNNNPVFPPNLVFGTAVGAQTMSIVNAGGSFNVDNFATNRFLRIDPTAHVFAIGDMDNANLGNVLFIDDGFFGDESLGYSSGGVLWLTVGPGANGFTIGDQALTTGVLLTGDNTNNRLRFQNAAGIYLDLTAGAVRNYKIGQVTGSNGTHLNINDATNTFIFNNTGSGVAKFEPAGGQINIFKAGFSGRIFLANSAASDGLIFDGNLRAMSSGGGASTITIGINVGENVGIAVAAPTARLHIIAGTAAAGNAPLKFTSGVNLTAAEAGAMEWDGINLFITQTAGPTRKTIAYTTDIPAALIFSTGLTNTAGTITANISTGIAGGQTIIGGTGAGDNLTISTTSSGTKGKIIFGTASAYDQVNDRLGIGITSPLSGVHISQAGTANPQLRAGAIYTQSFGVNNGRISDNGMYDGSNFIRVAAGFTEYLNFAGGEVQIRSSGNSATPGSTAAQTVTLKSNNDGTFQVGALSGTAGDYTLFNFSISSVGKMSLTATNTPAGTTGNQTINKASGTVNIAAAGTTVTVTNSLVTTASLIFCQLRTNDTTATGIKSVVPGAGSFVITLTAAATAEVSIGFHCIN